MKSTIKELKNVKYYANDPASVRLKLAGEISGIFEILDLNSVFVYLIARCTDTKKVYIIKRKSIK